MRTVLTLSAIFLIATLVLYLSARANRRFRPARVFVSALRGQSEAEVVQVTKYLRAACPDAVLVNLEPRADYSLIAKWNPNQGPLAGWLVVLSRKGEDTFLKQGRSDAMQVFREGCTAIRDDS